MSEQPQSEHTPGSLFRFPRFSNDQPRILICASCFDLFDVTPVYEFCSLIIEPTRSSTRSVHMSDTAFDREAEVSLEARSGEA